MAKKRANIGKVNWADLFLLKLAVISGTLFLLNLLPGVVAWMEVQHWGWFLGAMVLFMIIPMKKRLWK